MNIREKIERSEETIFIDQASFSSKSKGRERAEKKDEVRTCFMVDRDRIIHSKSFRRLKHKMNLCLMALGIMKIV